jgi:hypothetical protein
VSEVVVRSRTFASPSTGKPAARLIISTYTLSAPCTEQTKSDYRTWERFVFDNGRDPRPGDGEAWEALSRIRGGNLEVQAVTPKQPYESEASADWRQSTATKALQREAGHSNAAATIYRRLLGRVRALQRPRERRSERRSLRLRVRSGSRGDPGRPGSEDDADDLSSRPSAGVSAWRPW